MDGTSAEWGANGVASRKFKKSGKRGQAKKRLTNNIPKPKKPKLYKQTSVKKVPRPKLIKGETRDLKTAWNYLRRLGLIKSKRKASKIKNSDKRARQQVERFRDVVRGSAEALPLDPKTAAEYRKAGRRVVNNTLIVRKRKGESVIRKKRRVIKRRKVKGGEIITISVPKSLAQTYADIDAIRDDPDLVELLNQGYRLSVRFGDSGHWNYGYRYIPVKGVGVDAAISEMREYIDHYNTPPHSPGDWPSGVYTGTVFEHEALELIAVRSGFSTPPRQKPRRAFYRSQKHVEKAAKREAKRWRRIKSNPAKYARHKLQSREAMRRMRARNKPKSRGKRK